MAEIDAEIDADDELDPRAELDPTDEGVAFDADSYAADDADADDDVVPIDSTLDDSALIASARRRHGALGGLMAAGMLGIDKVLGRKPKEEVPVVVASPTEPIDIDSEGITVALDEHTDLFAPPIPRSEPKVGPARRRRR